MRVQPSLQVADRQRAEVRRRAVCCSGDRGRLRGGGQRVRQAQRHAQVAHPAGVGGLRDESPQLRGGAQLEAFEAAHIFAEGLEQEQKGERGRR